MALMCDGPSLLKRATVLPATVGTKLRGLVFQCFAVALRSRMPERQKRGTARARCVTYGSKSVVSRRASHSAPSPSSSVPPRRATKPSASAGSKLHTPTAAQVMASVGQLTELDGERLPLPLRALTAPPADYWPGCTPVSPPVVLKGPVVKGFKRGSRELG